MEKKGNYNILRIRLLFGLSGKMLPKIRPQICPAVNTFIRPSFSFAAEESAGREHCMVVLPVLPPEPVPGHAVVVPVGVHQGGHIPVHSQYTVSAIMNHYSVCWAFKTKNAIINIMEHFRSYKHYKFDEHEYVTVEKVHIFVTTFLVNFLQTFSTDLKSA
jgi:hypothetical protein